jgi:hypothetical protein
MTRIFVVLASALIGCGCQSAPEMKPIRGARQARFWIMARKPGLAPAERDRLVSRVRELGYDTTLLRVVPHRARN